MQVGVAASDYFVELVDQCARRSCWEQEKRDDPAGECEGDAFGGVSVAEDDLFGLEGCLPDKTKREIGRRGCRMEVAREIIIADIFNEVCRCGKKSGLQASTAPHFYLSQSRPT